MTGSNKQDIYTRITDQIVSALEQGVKPWTRPWSATHAAGTSSASCRATSGFLKDQTLPYHRPGIKLSNMERVTEIQYTFISPYNCFIKYLHKKMETSKMKSNRNKKSENEREIAGARPYVLPC